MDFSTSHSLKAEQRSRVPELLPRFYGNSVCTAGARALVSVYKAVGSHKLDLLPPNKQLRWFPRSARRKSETGRHGRRVNHHRILMGPTKSIISVYRLRVLNGMTILILCSHARILIHTHKHKWSVLVLCIFHQNQLVTGGATFSIGLAPILPLSCLGNGRTHSKLISGYNICPQPLGLASPRNPSNAAALDRIGVYCRHVHLFSHNFWLFTLAMYRWLNTHICVCLTDRSKSFVVLFGVKQAAYRVCFHFFFFTLFHWRWHCLYTTRISVFYLTGLLFACKCYCCQQQLFARNLRAFFVCALCTGFARAGCWLAPQYEPHELQCNMHTHIRRK